MSTEPKLTAGEWLLVYGLNQDFQQWRRDKGPKQETYPIKVKDLLGLLSIVNRLTKDGETKEKLPNG